MIVADELAQSSQSRMTQTTCLDHIQCIHMFLNKHPRKVQVTILGLTGGTTLQITAGPEFAFHLAEGSRKLAQSKTICMLRCSAVIGSVQVQDHVKRITGTLLGTNYYYHSDSGKANKHCSWRRQPWLHSGHKHGPFMIITQSILPREDVGNRVPYSGVQGLGKQSKATHQIGNLCTVQPSMGRLRVVGLAGNIALAMLSTAPIATCNTRVCSCRLGYKLMNVLC